jgi:hypothetical protein
VIVVIIKAETPSLTQPEGCAEEVCRIVLFQVKVIHVDLDFRLPILGRLEIPGHVMGNQIASQDDAFIPLFGG